MKKIGNRQVICLRMLDERGAWPGGNWEWDNTSTTITILESLVRRGYVETYETPGTYQKEPVTHYQITDAGRAAYAASLVRS